MTEQKRMRRVALIAGAVATLPLASCVTVSPPDKPIEINLNVTIKQEVLVRLQRDVEQLIRENPDAFPQGKPGNSAVIRRLLFGAAALASAAVPASAQYAATVLSARAAGQVGERFDGYLGYVSAPASSLRAQVDAINIRRRALYANLAVKRGVAQQDVGITVGCQTLGTVAAGEAYMLSDGVWRRRAATQGPPVPDYCR